MPVPCLCNAGASHTLSHMDAWRNLTQTVHKAL
jgi:hypothetical protein